LDDILGASPFDRGSNFNGALTEEMFYDLLFVRDEVCDSFEKELSEVLTSSIVTSKMVFLESYAGTGKTTLIKHFIHSNSSFNHVYVDFYELSALGSGASGRSIGVDRVDAGLLSLCSGQIWDTLFAFLRERVTGDLEKTLAFLREREGRITKFFSVGFWELPEEMISTEVALARWLESLPVRDLYLLVLLASILSSERDEKTVFFFDNLDAISSEVLDAFFGSMLPELNTISLAFFQALELASGFSLARDACFVFSLRDTTLASINPHQRDAFEYQTLSMSVYLPNKRYRFRSIVERRLDLWKDMPFVNEQDIYQAKQFRAWFRSIMDDDGLSRIWFPFFNYNIRRLCFELVRIANENVDSIKLSSVDSVSQENVGNVQYILSRNMFRGANRNILYNVESNFFEGEERSRADHCRYIHILSLVYNLILADLRNGELIEGEGSAECSLMEIIDATRGLYTPREVLHTLNDLAQADGNSPIRFISMTPAYRARLNVSELNVATLNLGEFEFKGIRLTEEEGATLDSAKTSLSAVAVSPTPAGYAFLKHIYFSYEFWSVMAGATTSLYKADLIEDILRGQLGELQKLVERTLGAVRRSIAGHTLVTRRLRAAVGDSKSLDLICKMRTRHSKALLPHTLRIIDCHIRHLDSYRKYLIERCFDGDAKENEEPLAVEVNRYAIRAIESYVSLMNEIDDDIVDRRMAAFEKALHAVQSSKNGLGINVNF